MMWRNASIACVAFGAAAALAHDGHGFAGTHLHAGDMLGFTLIGLAIAGLALWRGRKGKARNEAPKLTMFAAPRGGAR